MSFDTISISALQRKGQKAFTDGSFIQFVMVNNKKTGLIFNQEALAIMESTGVLDELEDKLLSYHMDMTYKNDDFISLDDLKDEVSNP
jgi:hypothetical protein